MRHLVPPALAVAALLAALVVVVAAAGDPAGGDRGGPAGPAVRLADRPGLVTVGMAARDDGIELTVIAPNIDADAPEVREVTVASGGAPAQRVDPEGCGDGCVVVPVRLGRGAADVRARVGYLGRETVARFRFPWPMSGDATSLLRDAADRVREGRQRWTIRERVTSDAASGVFANPPQVVTGRFLASTWNVSAAEDVRELPPVGGVRRVAYVVPAETMWFEVWIDRGGRIVRDRVVAANHRLTRTFTPVPG